MNIIYWVTRVIKWVYYHADIIPKYIQNAVDRKYQHNQEKEWELKNENANYQIRTILTKEFPELFKKKFIDPYKKGSNYE